MPDRRGAVLFTTFLMMLVLAGLALAIGVIAHNSQVGGRSQQLDKQALYIAEAGWQRARQALVAGTWSAATGAGNTYTESFGTGQYKVTIVDNGDSTYTITSEGYLPDQTNTAAKRRVVEANLSVTTGYTNLALSATASASGSHSTHTPGNSNDGATSTRWECTDDEDCWLQLDFGSTTTVDRVILEEHGSRIEQEDLTIQYSSNGSSWTNVSSPSISTTGSTDWTINFTAATQRYFRVFIEEADGRPRIKEFEAYHIAGGTTTTLGNGTFRTQW